MNDDISTLEPPEVWILFDSLLEKARETYRLAKRPYLLLSKSLPPVERDHLFEALTRSIAETIRGKGHVILSRGRKPDIERPYETLSPLHTWLVYHLAEAERLRQEVDDHLSVKNYSLSDLGKLNRKEAGDLLERAIAAVHQLDTVIEWYVSQLQCSAVALDCGRGRLYYYDFNSEKFVYEDGNVVSGPSG